MKNKTDPFGRISKFDKLSSKMLFNIFIYRPDPLVFDFIKKYFPVFTEKYVQGGWTVYPPGSDPIEEPQLTVHSFVFRTHPHFDTRFREGRIDLLASERKDGSCGVRDFCLWFMFDTKRDANNAFKKLSGTFNKLSKKKRVIKSNSKTIAIYSDQDDLESTNNVLLILTKDELYDGKYKLFFRICSLAYSN